MPLWGNCVQCVESVEVSVDNFHTFVFALYHPKDRCYTS